MSEKKIQKSNRDKRFMPGDMIALKIDDDYNYGDVALYKILDDEVWYDEWGWSYEYSSGVITPNEIAIVIEAKDWKSKESDCRLGTGVYIMTKNGAGWIPDELICHAK